MRNFCLGAACAGLDPKSNPTHRRESNPLSILRREIHDARSRVIPRLLRTVLLLDEFVTRPGAPSATFVPSAAPRHRGVGPHDGSDCTESSYLLPIHAADVQSRSGRHPRTRPGSGHRSCSVATRADGGGSPMRWINRTPRHAAWLAMAPFLLLAL